MIAIDTTVLIGEFRAKGRPLAPRKPCPFTIRQRAFSGACRVGRGVFGWCVDGLPRARGTSDETSEDSPDFSGIEGLEVRGYGATD
jgi:hypothetical protein